MTHPRIVEITNRIIERSKVTRTAYLEKIRNARTEGPARTRLSCGNLAHGFAACGKDDKAALAEGKTANIAVTSAYNEMLSAHQPYGEYLPIIQDAAHKNGVTAQFAGGVPAMCDGVTQGREGMELSLFSRDLIAMATAIGLSHDMFDASMYLGVCDKIVPGLMIGALTFGHLPSIFVPAGPMPTGLANAEKVRIRQLFAEGKVGRKELLECESQSYHSAGTCTFYGTANSNQMLMEVMGLHLPGSSFVNPGTPMREALTREAVKQVTANTDARGNYTPIGEMIDEKMIVNGMIGLTTTGGSTNHLIHLVAIARAAGIQINWTDMSELSDVIPLLCRIYPNGLADVNRFHAVGGMGFLMRELRDAGLMHDDVTTVMGKGLDPYTKEPFLENGAIIWKDCPLESLDDNVLRPASNPFTATGGLKLLDGNLGRSVSKISAVKPDNRYVKAPAIVFHTQEALQVMFKAGELEKDFIAVLRFQGPKANGMPELHKLTPPLGVLQDRGFKVALVTDGRMSGASGKVPSAIHLTPEALDKGPIALVQDGDIIELDTEKGELILHVDAAELAKREHATQDMSDSHVGMGRELFAPFRAAVGLAEKGASIFNFDGLDS